MRKNEEEQSTLVLRYGKAILLGGLIGFGIGLILLFFVSFGIAQGLLNISHSYQFTVIGCVLGGFFGGIICINQCRGQNLLMGLLTGAVVFLLQLSFGLFMFETFTFENGGLGLLCGALCGGAAAGILKRGKGTRSRGKKRYKR